MSFMAMRRRSGGMRRRSGRGVSVRAHTRRAHSVRAHTRSRRRGM